MHGKATASTASTDTSASRKSAWQSKLSSACTNTKNAMSQIASTLTPSRVLPPLLAGSAIYCLRDQFPSPPTTLIVSDGIAASVTVDAAQMARVVDTAKTALLGAAMWRFGQSMFDEMGRVWGSEVSIGGTKA